MKEISVFIRADKKETGEFVEILAPLLDALDCELILVAKEEADLDVGRRHSVCAYEGAYEKFQAFCLAAAEADRVMILEAGVKIYPELIERIIERIGEGGRRNIVSTVKDYLDSDRLLYFERKEPLVLHRGVRGFDLDCEMTVEGYGFLREDADAVEDGVEKLMVKARYDALSSWYTGFILKLPECGQEAFRDALEKYRAFHETPGDAKNLDEMLIRADGGETEYARTLQLRGLVRTGGDVSEILKRLKSLPVLDGWSHQGWLMREFLLTADHGLEYLTALDGTMLERWLISLLEKDPEAPDTLYRFLVIHQSVAATGSERVAFVRAALICIDYLQTHTNGPESIRRMVKTADWLVSDAGHEPEPDMWISALAAARALEADGKAEDAVLALDEACRAFPPKLGVLRHCIQKIRYERGLHPFALSICMIVKNEEKNLERCLRSLKPLTDSGLAELIVADTGSTDRTVEIASEYAGKLFSHPWSGNFSEARNFTILHADGEYVMTMDADEEIEAEGVQKLLRWFSEGSYRAYQTCTLRLVSFTDERHTQYAVMAQPRIFKNTGLFSYSSAVHNQPVCASPVTSLYVDILHYGYIMTDDIRDVKFQRTATLLKRELIKNPNHLYYRYQLSTSYAMYGNMKEAAKQVDLYLRLIRREPALHDIVLMYYNNAASIYINCHRYDDVDTISDTALKIQPDFIDFQYYKACVLFAGEKFDAALAYIDRYLELLGSFPTLGIAKDGRFAFYTVGCAEDVKQMFIVSNCRTGRYDRAIPMTFELKDDAQIKNCLLDVMGACFRALRFADLAHLYATRVAASTEPYIHEVFVHFLRAFLFRADSQARADCIGALAGSCVSGEAWERLASGLVGSGSEFIDLSLVGKYSLDGAAFESMIPFFGESANLVLSFDVDGCDEALELCRMKKLAATLLHRTEQLLDSLFSDEDIAGVYNRYMEICAKLTKIARTDLLEGREKVFITKMLSALEGLGTGKSGEAAEDLRDAAMDYHSMDGFLRFATRALIPQRAGIAPGASSECSEENSPVSHIALKAQIAERNGDMTADEILTLFAQSGGDENLDAELCALKSSALILRGRLDEAEACLDGAVRRFPMARDLFFSRFALYQLRQDIPNATRAYCRLRMLDPTNAQKLGATPMPPMNVSSLKVLHGAMDLTPRVASLAEALRSKGICARSVNYAPQASPPYPDYALDVNAIDSGDEILATTAEIAAELISEYDVFHFHYGTTLTFNHFDLIALRELGKKAIMHYWRRDAAAGNKMRNIGRYVKRCVVSDEGVYEQAKDWFEDVRIVRPMVDMGLVRPTYGGVRRDAFTIVHAPVSKELKGTEHILKAIDELSGRYPIDFRVIQEMPHDKAMRLYRDADLIVDQLLDGSYGMLAVEGMALGKPVVCFISEHMREQYPAGLPIVSAEPANIREVLEDLIKHRDTLPEFGRKGRAYAQEYHDMDKETAKLIELYREQQHPGRYDRSGGARKFPRSA